jgi:hypothetical protein
MASAGFELQKAVHAVLVADAALSAMLGGSHVYDDVPRGQAYPYVTFGQSTERDWSTGGEDGREHLLTLHVWSRARGHKETLEIMAALRAALHDRALALGGFRLVNIRHEYSDAQRDADAETYHGTIRYRAVTEVSRE